jgi:hypothetical protein
MMIRNQYQTSKVDHMPIFVVLLFFLWSRCISLEIFSLVIYGIDFSVVSVCFILLWLNFYFFIFKKRPFHSNFYTKSLVWLFFIIIIPIALTSVIGLNQPLTALITRPLFFLGYLLLPFLIFLQMDDQKIIKLFNLLMVLTGIACLLVIIGSMFPDVRSWFSEGIVATRYQRVRLGTQILPNLTKLLFFYTVVMSFKGANRKLRMMWMSFSLTLFWMVSFVWGTRQVVLGFIATLLFFWLFCLRSVEKVRSFVTVLIIVLIIYLFFGRGQNSTESYQYLGQLFGSISKETSDISGTIGVRIGGIEYYYEEFAKSKFIGFGMVSTTENIDNPLYIGMSSYGFNLNDLGLVGMVFSFGFPVVIFLIVIFYRMINDFNYTINNNRHKKIVVIAETFRLYLISEIIYFPFTKAFFFPKFSLFYGLMMFYAWRLSIKNTEPTFSSQSKIKSQFREIVN